MDINKVIKKGLEGAIIGGGCGGAASQDPIAAVVAAAVGFLLKAGKNWWKHRK
ncbi:MAG: hypothetical protein V3U21_00385 [Thermodesulfobacteriota bacterium]|jgi:hypothetical protein|tara:strand:+ start:883 stop:1041 length:159 start_codon:yes stop_codon:yes gene_type:complete